MPFCSPSMLWLYFSTFFLLVRMYFSVVVPLVPLPNQTCKSLLEKQGRAHKWCTPMHPRIWQDNKLEYTSSSYVRIWDAVLKTCQWRWMIGRSGEWGSRISVPVARHDDDNDDVPLPQRITYSCIQTRYEKFPKDYN